MRPNLRRFAPSVLVALLLSACGDAESDAPGGPPTTSAAWGLSLDLIQAPSTGGPWIEQPDDHAPRNDGTIDRAGRGVGPLFALDADSQRCSGKKQERGGAEVSKPTAKERCKWQG